MRRWPSGPMPSSTCVLAAWKLHKTALVDFYHPMLIAWSPQPNQPCRKPRDFSAPRSEIAMDVPHTVTHGASQRLTCPEGLRKENVAPSGRCW